MIYLGIDIGNHDTEGSNNIKYKSGAREVINAAGINPDARLVFCNDKTLLVGEIRSAMQYDKTSNLNMLALTLPIIAEKIEQEFEPRKQTISLGIGVPLTQMRNLRDKYVTYFKGKNVTFTYKKNEYDVTFGDVRCYPQGYSVLLHHYAEIMKPNGTEEIQALNVIDIGGGTADAFQMINGKPSTDTFRTFNMGVIHLLNRIKTEMDAEGIQVSDELLLLAIQKKHIFHKKANCIEKICVSFATEYVNEMIAELETSGYDLSLPTVWIGGGYQLFKEYISKNEKIFTIKEFDEFANAKAYEWLIRNGK